MSTAVETSPTLSRRRYVVLGVAGWLLPLATLALLVLAWHVATLIFDWPRWLVPSPVDVWFDQYHRLVRQEFTETGHRTIVQLVAVRR